MIFKTIWSILLLTLIYSQSIQAQNSLFIPDTLSGPTLSLLLHRDSVQFFSGRITKTNAFGTNSYLGPTLILNKGNEVNINVINTLGDTTTVHWHGLHISPQNDGGPHTIILPNSTWSPKFKVMDNASTYWYHPHLHKKTALQVMRGAAGLIIVRDSSENELNLPRTYGKDDFPIIVQSQQFDSMNQIMHRGMEDSILLVNGTLNPFLNVPAQVVRLRLLNASQERTFNFGFTNNLDFYVIGTDGGLLKTPVSTKRVRLSPGERAQVLLNLNDLKGKEIYLMSYASELPMGIQGGPTMPMPPGSPPMDSPLNGIDFNILKLNIGNQTTNPITNVITSLVDLNPIPENQAKITRTIRFTADSAEVMDGPFYFNDSLFDMMRIDYTIPLNSTEIWKLVNTTMVAHPFHIHGGQFLLIDRNNKPINPIEAGWKDVVLVPPSDSLRFIMTFVNFADTTTPYMFHCHILMHEDDGMMGQYIVTPGKPNSVEINSFESTDIIDVYPNPSRELLNITLKVNKSDDLVRIKIFSLIGQQVYEGAFQGNNINLDISDWSNGLYAFEIIRKNQSSTGKFQICR
jgi:bilirubin oxidase